MGAHVAATTVDTFRELAPQRRWLAQLDEDILAEQIRVAEIPAPTGHEGERARWVASRFRAMGLQPVTDGAGNVIARAAGAYAGAPVVVCAHLDTVFPANTVLTVQRAGDRLVGPGICDNGRGLAVMLTLARVLQRCAGALARAVEFVATTGEEGSGNLRGAKHYFTGAPRPFAVIALDGAGDERIVNTGLASRRLRVSYRGPGGHSWAAFGAPNAVHTAARAAAQIADLHVRGAGRSSLTVSRIGGGMAVNSIPEDAWFEIDARSTSGDTLSRMERDIRAIARAAAVQENDARTRGTPVLVCDVEQIGDRPGGETAAESALVTAALEATRLVGRAAELATASTDANAAMSIGAPAIAIGGGGHGGDAHSTREWFDNRDGSAGVARTLTIVATMARLAAD
jgi:acetylornithine deacetylase/succinyl-diaminopimelate desuccinylase-like protein